MLIDAKRTTEFHKKMEQSYSHHFRTMKYAYLVMSMAVP